MTPITAEPGFSPLTTDPSEVTQEYYDQVVIEDDQPVDSIYSSCQMHLLLNTLQLAWQGRTYLALSNVGLFYSKYEPPIVPDVMVSVEAKKGRTREKKNLSYFVWEIGKIPEVAIEIVSNKVGGELDRKKAIYAHIGIPHYVVWDPEEHLDSQPLHSFILRDGVYENHGLWLEAIGLGLKVWDGFYTNQEEGPYLRWCDTQGNVLKTGSEMAAQERHEAEKERRLKTLEQRRAKTERQKADTERQKAEAERQKADAERQKAEAERQKVEKLRAQLRAAGIDPDA